jgi:hypothetical protein
MFMKSNLKHLFISPLLLLTILLFSNDAVAACPSFFAFVDKNQSTYPKCLEINGGMFCGGDLEVKNNCSQEVTLNDKIISPGETKYGFKEVYWNYNSSEQKKQTWVLKGVLGKESFVVKGQTENWSDKNSLEHITQIIPFSIKITILLFLIGIPSMVFIIIRTKR